MTDRPPRAAILIPHRNDTGRLTRCLTALFDGAAPGDLDAIEVVVIDNGSAQDVRAALAPWPWVRILHEPRTGAAHARNAGVAATSAPLLWFMDADCVPSPGWAHQAMHHAGQADIVAGGVTLFDETPAPRTGAEAFETVFAFDVATYVRQGFGVTANLLTTRDMFDRTGPFAHGQPEDKDWCLRARTKGATIAYAPDLCVTHPTRSDWPALRAKWHRLTQEAWAQYRATPGGRIGWALKAGIVAASGLGHLPRVLTSSKLRGGERLRGAGTLLAIRAERAWWMLRQAAGGQI